MRQGVRPSTVHSYGRAFREVARKAMHDKGFELFNIAKEIRLKPDSVEWAMPCARTVAAAARVNFIDVADELEISIRRPELWDKNFELVYLRLHFAKPRDKRRPNPSAPEE